MAWQRFVGSLNFQVFFAKEPCKKRYSAHEQNLSTCVKWATLTNEILSRMRTFSLYSFQVNRLFDHPVPLGIPISPPHQPHPLHSSCDSSDPLPFFWLMLLLLLRKKSSSSFARSCMCSNLVLWIRDDRVFPDIFVPLFFSFLMCKVFVSNKSLSSAPLRQAPVPGCRHSSCALFVYMCLCVSAFVCACENVYVKW